MQAEKQFYEFEDQFQLLYARFRRSSERERTVIIAAFKELNLKLRGIGGDPQRSK